MIVITMMNFKSELENYEIHADSVNIRQRHLQTTQMSELSLVTTAKLRDGRQVYC